MGNGDGRRRFGVVIVQGDLGIGIVLGDLAAPPRLWYNSARPSLLGRPRARPGWGRMEDGIKTEFPRTFVPAASDMGDWAQIEPLFDALDRRELEDVS